MKDDAFERLLQNAAYNFGESYIDTSDLLYEPHEFSGRFEKKIHKLIKKQRRFYFPLVKTPLRLSFTIIAMVILMTFTTVMSVGAIREKIVGFIVNTFSDHSDIMAVRDDQHPETIEEKYELGYDLSGYNIDFKSIYEHGYILTYKNKYTGANIHFEQLTKDGFNIGINTEDAKITYIDMNGYETMFFVDNHNYSNYIWDNGRYYFIISSNLSEDETFKIASSVRCSDPNADHHPNRIEDIYEIGYDLSSFDIYDEFYDNTSRYTMYLKDDNKCVAYHQYTKSNFDVRVNTEGAEITNVKVYTFDAIYFYNNNNYHNLIWDNGKYIFMLSSNLSKDETFEIAQSIRKSG